MVIGVMTCETISQQSVATVDMDPIYLYSLAIFPCQQQDC